MGLSSNHFSLIDLVIYKWLELEQELFSSDYDQDVYSNLNLYF